MIQNAPRWFGCLLTELRVVMGDRGGLLGLGLLRRDNQPQQNQQNQCNRADGSCGTALIDKGAMRKEMVPCTGPVPVPSCGTTRHMSSPTAVTSSGPSATAVDTSQAKPIGNGMRAQTNANGSITVTIPLTMHDIGVGSKLDYSYKGANTSAPRHPLCTGGTTKDFESSVAADNQVQAIKVFNRATQSFELQVTLKDAKTSSQIWIGDRSYALEPAKIKAEMARSKTKERAGGSGASSEITERDSKKREEKGTETAATDKLSELKEGIKAAIAKAGAPTATAEEKAAKKGLEGFLKAVQTVENKLAGAQKVLESSLENPFLSADQKKDITSRIEKITEARNDGILRALSGLSSDGNIDPKKFDAKAFVDQFKELWTAPKSEKPTESEKPKDDKKKLETTGEAAKDLRRDGTKQLDDALAPAKEQLELLTEAGLKDRNVENLKRIFTEVEVVKQGLLEERAKLVEQAAKGADAANKARIEQIDRLLDRDIPLYLKEQLYKKGEGLPPHTHLENLAEIAHKKVSIQNKFKDELRMPTSAALEKDQAISVDQPKEIEIQRGEAVRILNAKGEVVAEVKKDPFNNLSVSVPNKTADEKFAALETTPDGKVVMKSLENPTEKITYTLERKDYVNDSVIKSEQFSIVPKPGTVTTPPAGTTVTPAPEVAKEKEQMEAVLKLLKDPADRREYVEKEGYAVAAGGGSWIKQSEADANQIIVIKDLAGVPTVRIEAAAPSAPPSVTPANAAAQEQLKTLQETLAILPPGKAKSLLEVQDYTAEGTDLVKPSLDPNYKLVVDKDFKASLVPVSGVVVPPPEAPLAAPIITPAPEKMKELAKRFLDDLTGEETGNWVWDKHQLEEYAAMRVNETLEKARVGGYMDAFGTEAFNLLKARQSVPADITSFDELLRNRYLKLRGGLFDAVVGNSIAEDQAAALRNSRFGTQAVLLAEEINNLRGFTSSNDARNDVLPRVRAFVEGDPKRWKDLEDAYEFVSYDKTPLGEVLDKFDVVGGVFWSDGYTPGQDMNKVYELLKPVEAEK